ncbi:MAG: DUF4384 domain-containing protein [Leptolyngbya sp. DLM2.Bin15]|nr:MAG: DUF4384 domain-containing protein [Leptolyngbya sp. DLM2.Bin15]
MTRIKRRHFLQAAGSTLAAMGLSQLDFLTQANQYGRVLAQGTPRKLALLVGINNYTTANPLQGCLTDVELQRELLIHRFGFNPSDIVSVWDNASTNDLKPSRENILRVFQEHLIDQAKDGDVVVFHFSGHGSRVADFSSLDTDECRQNDDCHLNGTLVPNDPVTQSSDGETSVVADIMGRSLFLLTHAIQTNNVTMVLDSCYSGAGTRGNTIVRAIPRLTHRSAEISAAELELQQQFLSRARISLEDFEDLRQRGIANGMAIGSARREQLALDYSFDGFHAGAFTYLLTRYLWQLSRSETAETTFVNLARSTRALANRHPQEPIIEFKPGSANQAQPLYFMNPSSPTAEAVITDITGSQIAFWLGGVSVQNITALNTVFTVLGADGQVVTRADGTPIEIQQNGRSGLEGISTVVEAGDRSRLEEGQLLRERVVGIPANPVLRIGLDDSLGADMESARTALETALMAGNVNRIEVLPVDPTGSTALDYILGRMTDAYAEQLRDAGETNLPPLGSVGLFTPSLSPLTHLFGRVNEPGAAAVNRLRSQFRLLLVSQVLDGIASTHSDLKISGEVFAASGVGTPVPISTRSGLGNTNPRVTTTPVPFRAGENISIRLDNQEERDMYLSCLAIDSVGNLITLYPADWEAPEEAARIDRNNSLTVPRPQDDVQFAVSGSGHIQLLTLVSTSPLRNVLRGLEAMARSRGVQRSFIQLEDDEPLTVIEGLLGDIDSLSRERGGGDATIGVVTSSTQRAVDTDVLAAFSTMIEIRE